MVRTDLTSPAPSTISVVVIGGPTASGKTGVGLALARAFGGEIVNGDSVQMVRGFDLGSAKPSRDERAAVPHHLLDVVDPRDDLSAGRFVRLADRAIVDIAARGRLPVVVGGTGLYLRALVEGLADIPQVPAAVRSAQAERLAREGLPALRDELERLDPAYATRIAPTDRQRTLRALEVLVATGRPFSSFHGGGAPRPGHRFLQLALFRERSELHARIDARVDAMMAAGFLDEVRELRAAGLDLSVKPMTSLGYRQLFEHLAGAYDLDTAVAAIKAGHRHYAKRQLTWFRGRAGVRLIHADLREEQIEAVRRFLTPVR
jgi:tRNA dimethylallyltransferase